MNMETLVFYVAMLIAVAFGYYCGRVDGKKRTTLKE